MIKSFGDKSLEECFRKGRCGKISGNLRDRILVKLDMLNAATSLEDIAQVPGNHLHPLKGKRAGEYALAVNGPWRLVFRFENGYFYNICLEQYH